MIFARKISHAHHLGQTASCETGLMSVVGGILSLIIILIIGVSALGFIILIIQNRNLKSQLVKQ